MMVSKQQFHSFDALRFFSFFIVFVSHLPYELFNTLHFLHLKGTIGVSFFFVLSGFLITYILLHEKTQTSTIQLKDFFVRRILRIWPLYYCILLFAILSSYLINLIGLDSSNNGYEPNWFVSALFLENYQNIFHNDVGNVSPMPVLWSLCIEEHFYILWGIGLYLMPKKRIPLVIVVLIISATIARIVFLNHQWPFKDITTNIDYFMYGAIPAYLFVFAKEQTIKVVSTIPMYLKIVLPVLIVAYLFSANSIYFPYYELVEPIVFGVLFGGLILLFLPEPNPFKISDRSIFSKWGKYTYSLYLIHVIVINLFIQMFRRLDIDFEQNYLIFILLAFATTLLGSHLSYRWIEKPFLRLKKGFQ